MLYRIVRELLVALLRAWLRVSIAGRENVPTAGPFILAPTHRSNIDFVLAGAVTRRRLRFMTKDSVWRVPVLGKLVEQLGGFPVNRGTPDRQAIARSLTALSQGDGLVLFPEGQRRTGDAVNNLYDGVAYLAARAQVPILPIGIAGSEHAQPPGQIWIRPRSRIRIVVGPALAPRDTPGTRIPRSAVRALTERLEANLGALHAEARAGLARP